MTDRAVLQLYEDSKQSAGHNSTLLHDPELVILDKPFAGLDPVNTGVMKDIVVELARNGRTVLCSTHIMDEAEKLCHSVCIIVRGEKAIDGPLADVKREQGGQHLVVALESGVRFTPALIENRSLVAKADEYGRYAELELAMGVDPQVTLAELVRSGSRVTRFEIAEPTVNEILIDLVGADAATIPANPESGNV